MHIHRIGSTLLLLVTAACGSSLPPPGVFSPTRDPLTRFVDAPTEQLLEAGVASLRDIGFEIEDPRPGAEIVFSEAIVVQSNWRNRPLAERVLCGVGTAVTSDAYRVRQLANQIPVELKLGYEVEPRPGTTAITLRFEAQGRRTPAEYFATPTMSCTLSVAFVDELFDAVEEMLAMP